MVVARPILTWSVVIAASFIIAWLVAGRQITLFLDRFITLRVESLPVSPLEFDIGDLRIGGVSLPLIGTDNLRFNLRVLTDSKDRLVLSTGGQSFILGPRLTPPDPAGRPDVKFTSEQGDELSLELRRSAFSRPTPPFQINVFGGSNPSWRRHLYYRLEWKKRSGGKLDMLWRFEQQYYSRTGWNDGYVMYDFSTGLLRVKISPEIIAQESVVVDYISQTKGWKRTDYRIENREVSADGRMDLVAVINLADERSPSPGAGLSVVLYVDRASHKVTQELGGQ